MKRIFMISAALVALASCSKDKDPIIVVPPSNGSSMTLDGGTGGTSAVNSVFVDFSSDKQTSVARSSWDLGFYCGSDFRVIINNTTSATALKTDKTDLSAVSSSDTVGKRTVILPNGASVNADFALLDALSGGITKTVIPAISATANDNKVIILNPVSPLSSGGVPARDYIKLRIVRNGENGYTMQYAGLNEATIKTINIDKDANFNFKYLSFATGTASAVTVEPAKKDWDIEWTLALSEVNFGELIPYPFSDLVFTNVNGGTTSFERIYADEATAIEAYTKFNKDSVTKYSFSGDKWRIGSNWRVTARFPGEVDPVGIRKYRFYVVKDAVGNMYKLKFDAAGLASQGGTRGKPEISYELLK